MRSAAASVSGIGPSSAGGRGRPHWRWACSQHPLDAGGRGRALLAAGAADPGDGGDAEFDQTGEEVEDGGGLGEAEQEHELARGRRVGDLGVEVQLAAAGVAAEDGGAPQAAVVVDELERGAVGDAADATGQEWLSSGSRIAGAPASGLAANTRMLTRDLPVAGSGRTTRSGRGAGAVGRPSAV